MNITAAELQEDGSVIVTGTADCEVSVYHVGPEGPTRNTLHEGRFSYRVAKDCKAKFAHPNGGEFVVDAKAMRIRTAAQNQVPGLRVGV